MIRYIYIQFKKKNEQKIKQLKSKNTPPPLKKKEQNLLPADNLILHRDSYRNENIFI